MNTPIEFYKDGELLARTSVCERSMSKDRREAASNAGIYSYDRFVLRPESEFECDSAKIIINGKPFRD